MRRTIAATLAVLSLTLLVGACSKSDQVEDKVAEIFKSAASVENVKVKCPGDVKADKGEEFDCTVSGDDLKEVGGDGTTEATIHVVFEKDNEFTIVSLKPTNGPNSGVEMLDTSGTSSISS
jgi:hypothetical protein